MRWIPIDAVGTSVGTPAVIRPKQTEEFQTTHTSSEKRSGVVISWVMRISWFSHPVLGLSWFSTCGSERWIGVLCSRACCFRKPIRFSAFQRAEFLRAAPRNHQGPTRQRLETVHCTSAETDSSGVGTFQIMRRTHASLSRQVGLNPKLVADQLGHGLGVSLDVYTVAVLDKRQTAVQVLETSLQL
jgi:hypothetical protein